MKDTLKLRVLLALFFLSTSVIIGVINLELRKYGMFDYIPSLILIVFAVLIALNRR